MTRAERQYARIEVDFGSRLRPLDEDELESAMVGLAAAPSVWSPSGESGLRDLVGSAAGTSEALLAQAVLDLTEQIVHLRSGLAQRDEPASYPARLLELSGGGGRLRTDLPLQSGETLELRIDDEPDGPPPVRCVIEVVRPVDDTPRCYGFRFHTMHPRDKDRMIRLIYSLQRMTIRRSHGDEAQEADDAMTES